MKDPRLWKLRNLELRKRRLTHTGYFLLCSITDYLYMSDAEDPENFICTIPMVQKWLGLKGWHNADRYLSELVKFGILVELGKTNTTPPKGKFRMPLDVLISDHHTKPKPKRRK